MHFYSEIHRQIFNAMLQLWEQNQNVDLINLTDLLRKESNFEAMGGASYVASLTHVVPSSANIVNHGQIVKRYSVLRKLIDLSNDTIQGAFEMPQDVESFLDQVEKGIFAISKVGRSDSVVQLKDVIFDSIEMIEKRQASESDLTGIPTPFRELNRLTCGFQPSDLIIIAGRPSMGKTSFALNIASYVALHQDYRVPTAVFSLEMSNEQLVNRMLCSEARIDSNKVRTGNLDDQDWQRLIHAADGLKNAPIFIDDTPAITTMALRSKVRRLKKEHDIGFVIVDYLQLMRSSATRVSESREREISDISRSLKALAKELSLPIMALSQLNRSLESRTDKRPMMSDLRESGALEQDSDVIGFIYRDEFYNKSTTKPGIAEFILAKQRNGPTGMVEMAFLNQFTRFENLEPT